MEAAARAARAAEDENADDEVDGAEEEVDVLMFAGMFRTGMEMVEDLHGLRL